MHDVAPAVAKRNPAIRYRVAPARVARASGKFERSGLVRRSDPFIPSLERLKEELRLITGKAKVPAVHRFAALAILCEATSNWWRHNPAGDLVYILSARPNVIEQVYRYQSDPFDVHPAPRDAMDTETLTEGGYGITVMRGLCNLDPATDEVPFDSPDVNFAFSNGWVTVRLIRRW